MGGAPQYISAAVVIGELQLWREVVRSAQKLHDDMDPAVRASVDARSTDAELLAEVPHVAGYSTELLTRLAGTLSAALVIIGEYSDIAEGDMPPRLRRQLIRLVHIKSG